MHSGLKYSNSPIFGFLKDFGFVYRRNRPKTTHSIRMDLQNVTNRYNAFSQYFSSETGNIEQSDQLGLFPFFDYRIEF